MDRIKFLEVYGKICTQMHTIMLAKNSDYAGTDDPFRNFRFVEHLGLCSTEEGILVRMCDKMSRIATLLRQEAAVKDESIQDTLMDLANYAVIMAAYLKREER